MVPEATWAEYSPRLWPATKLGLGNSRLKNSQRRNRSRENRGLRDLGQPQLIFRSFKTKLREFVAQGFVGFLKRLPRDGIFLG